MPPLAPPIYVRLEGSPKMSILQRLIAILVSICALGVLVIAACLVPSPSGIGTHTQLGMQPCQFLYQTGYPCAACGLTTSFAYWARGHLLASFTTQPFGFVLAGFLGVIFWSGLYCGLTGKASYRWIRKIPLRAHLWFWLGTGLFGWAWKTAGMLLDP
ncbi:MAG: hypothetical protein KatS3mg104_2507 [Phycisphaerae bacterium]|jgi:hypothetical protein|nr:MAG: hypothetical protein KatS3mg104_2507 [Phycisphaerae bacterium]